MELPVGKFADARDLVTGYAGAAGGYVVSSSARGGRSGTFVLRIPARKFDAVMQQLERMPGGKVLLANFSRSKHLRVNISTMRGSKLLPDS